MPKLATPATSADIIALLNKKASDKEIYNYLESNPSLYDRVSATGDSLLHLLIYYKREHLILVLLNGLKCIPAGKIDIHNDQHETPLYASIVACLPKVTQALIAAGANITPSDSGESLSVTPLSAFLNIDYRHCHHDALMQLFTIFANHLTYLPDCELLESHITHQNHRLVPGLIATFDKIRAAQASQEKIATDERPKVEKILQQALVVLTTRKDTVGANGEASCLIMRALETLKQESVAILQQAPSRTKETIFSRHSPPPSPGITSKEHRATQMSSDNITTISGMRRAGHSCN
jgi:hypothetical protein